LFDGAEYGEIAGKTAFIPEEAGLDVAVWV